MADIEANINTSDRAFIHLCYIYRHLNDFLIERITDDMLIGTDVATGKYERIPKPQLRERVDRLKELMLQKPTLKYLVDELSTMKASDVEPDSKVFNVELTASLSVYAKDEEDAFNKAEEEAIRLGIPLNQFYIYVDGKCRS